MQNLKSWCVHTLLHAILACARWPVNTHYTREILVMSMHFTGYVHYTCGVATVHVVNELLIGFFIQYRLKFLMYGRVHTTVIDSSYTCYDISRQEPIRSCCIVQNCLHANTRKLGLICSIYSCKLLVYNKLLSLQKTF